MTGRKHSANISIPNNGKRAAVYHRVSSEEQVEGYSLDAQRQATSAYCQAHDWAVVEEYRDERKSAWPTTSPHAPLSPG